MKVTRSVPTFMNPGTKVRDTEKPESKAEALVNENPVRRYKSEQRKKIKKYRENVPLGQTSSEHKTRVHLE